MADSYAPPVKQAESAGSWISRRNGRGGTHAESLRLKIAYCRAVGMLSWEHNGLSMPPGRQIGAHEGAHKTVPNRANKGAL